jgi:hypothetical protein
MFGPRAVAVQARFPGLAESVEVSGGREFLGDGSHFLVAVLADTGEGLKSLLGGHAVALHQDPFGLADQVARRDCLFQLVQMLRPGISRTADVTTSSSISLVSWWACKERATSLNWWANSLMSAVPRSSADAFLAGWCGFPGTLHLLVDVS